MLALHSVKDWHLAHPELRVVGSGSRGRAGLDSLESFACASHCYTSTCFEFLVLAYSGTP